MPPPERILVCAISGRALAQSAKAAGFLPLVLDRFGDDDTCAAADGCATVAAGAESPFSTGSLLDAATSIAPPPMPLVYGSGFDGAPGLLARLAQGRELLGMPPGGVARVKDPWDFAAACARLGIPHPPISAEPPADPGGWLVKRRGGAGGSHVREARGAGRLAKADYFQRRVAGSAVSAALLGDGRRCLVLALSCQWQRPHGSGHYAGALFPAGLAAPVERALRDAAVAIGEAYGVVGLGSADFLADEEGGFHLLEVNPRPGAALEAAELHLGMPLFGLHVAAARGRLPPSPPEPSAGVTATEIVWADRDLVMPERFAWPDWAGDRTPAGVVLGRGDPAATVRAVAGDPATALARLADRRVELLRMLANAARSA
ncbi:MAG TPA: ATP-grasp domain-containing protein [Geminicoccaceae bacterium]|nr:ATP-grasp domain-containing protein [Geminicoccus sp.]HMU49525.1 ATP-grasp domain-containing protein [Geminicoccaceae bacterium]